MHATHHCNICRRGLANKIRLRRQGVWRTARALEAFRRWSTLHAWSAHADALLRQCVALKKQPGIRHHHTRNTNGSDVLVAHDVTGRAAGPLRALVLLPSRQATTSFPDPTNELAPLSSFPFESATEPVMHSELTLNRDSTADAEPAPVDAKSSPSTEVVRASAKHAEAMAEFFRRVWDPSATAASVISGRATDARANPGSDGQESPTFLFLSNGNAVGYVGSIPTRLWNAGEEHRLHWIKGLMVLPEYRGGPVGYYVLREADRQVGSSMALVVSLAARRLFTALGYIDLGTLPNELRILRAGRVLSCIDPAALGLSRIPKVPYRVLRLLQRSHATASLGALAEAAFRAWVGIRGRANRKLQLSVDGAPPERRELDALWQQVRPSLGATQTRDALYVLWRYGADKGPYTFVTVREAGRLVGVGVVRRPNEEGDARLNGLRIATLAEALFSPERPAVGLALLKAAERAARAFKADALLSSGNAEALRSLTRRRAYVRIPGNVHFLIKDNAERCRMPRKLSEWWLTRGDAESDGVF